MAMRAQLSLMFDDEELFNEFITPQKDQRLLHGIIIKCLTAYYYNEEVRNLIEGSSLESVAESGSVTSTQAICDQIRTSLMMQSFLSTELQQTIDTGTEDINNILNKTNEFAETSGVARKTASEYGSGILQLEMKNEQSQAQQTIPTPSRADGNTAAVLELLLKAVGKLAESQGDSEVMQMLDISLGTSTPVATPVTTETVISEPIVQGVTVEENMVEEIEEVVVETTSQDEEPVEDDPVESQVTEAESNNTEDATDALKALFASLG